MIQTLGILVNYPTLFNTISLGWFIQLINGSWVKNSKVNVKGLPLNKGLKEVNDIKTVWH